ncbi:hypothetical protein VNO77_01774 [Canavalia gladiata]|uniref:Uncharacterized protein n=1 Tax=Canavalia gladiata TaxID=3824 RepID=A0AAN9R6L8_CANGL
MMMVVNKLRGSCLFRIIFKTEHCIPLPIQLKLNQDNLGIAFYVARMMSDVRGMGHVDIHAKVATAAELECPKTHPCLIKACSSLNLFSLGLSLHQYILVNGLSQDAYVASLINREEVDDAWTHMRSLGLRKIRSWSFMDNDIHGTLTTFFTDHTHPQFQELVYTLKF